MLLDKLRLPLRASLYRMLLDMLLDLVSERNLVPVEIEAHNSNYRVTELWNQQ